MSGYRNGADLERAAKHHLEDNGYYVIKSGGSKGIVDLAAFKPGELLFVQCKRAGYLSPSERRTLHGLAVKLGAVPLAAFWHKQGTAARTIAYVELFSLHGSPWSPDHGIADARATARALPQGGIG